MAQDTAAAERSAHVTRESSPTPPAVLLVGHGRSAPVVEVAPGIWMLRAVAELETRAKALEAQNDALLRAHAAQTLQIAALRAALGLNPVGNV